MASPNALWEEYQRTGDPEVKMRLAEWVSANWDTTAGQAMYHLMTGEGAQQAAAPTESGEVGANLPFMKDVTSAGLGIVGNMKARLAAGSRMLNAGGPDDFGAEEMANSARADREQAAREAQAADEGRNPLEKFGGGLVRGAVGMADPANLALLGGPLAMGATMGIDRAIQDYGVEGEVNPLEAAISGVKGAAMGGVSKLAAPLSVPKHILAMMGYTEGEQMVEDPLRQLAETGEWDPMRTLEGIPEAAGGGLAMGALGAAAHGEARAKAIADAEVKAEAKRRADAQAKAEKEAREQAHNEVIMAVRDRSFQTMKEARGQGAPHVEVEDAARQVAEQTAAEFAQQNYPVEPDTAEKGLDLARKQMEQIEKARKQDEEDAKAAQEMAVREQKLVLPLPNDVLTNEGLRQLAMEGDKGKVYAKWKAGKTLSESEQGDIVELRDAWEAKKAQDNAWQQPSTQPLPEAPPKPPEAPAGPNYEFEFKDQPSPAPPSGPNYEFAGKEAPAGQGVNDPSAGYTAPPPKEAAPAGPAPRRGGPKVPRTPPAPAEPPAPPKEFPPEARPGRTVHLGEPPPPPTLRDFSGTDLKLERARAWAAHLLSQEPEFGRLVDDLRKLKAIPDDKARLKVAKEMGYDSYQDVVSRYKGIRETMEQAGWERVTEEQADLTGDQPLDKSFREAMARDGREKSVAKVEAEPDHPLNEGLSPDPEPLAQAFALDERRAAMERVPKDPLSDAEDESYWFNKDQFRPAPEAPLPVPKKVEAAPPFELEQLKEFRAIATRVKDPKSRNELLNSLGFPGDMKQLGEAISFLVERNKRLKREKLEVQTKATPKGDLPGPGGEPPVGGPPNAAGAKADVPSVPGGTEGGGAAAATGAGGPGGGKPEGTVAAAVGNRAEGTANVPKGPGNGAKGNGAAEGNGAAGAATGPRTSGKPTAAERFLALHPESLPEVTEGAFRRITGIPKDITFAEIHNFAARFYKGAEKVLRAFYPQNEEFDLDGAEAFDRAIEALRNAGAKDEVISATIRTRAKSGTKFKQVIKRENLFKALKGGAVYLPEGPERTEYLRAVKFVEKVMDQKVTGDARTILLKLFPEEKAAQRVFEQRNVRTSTDIIERNPKTRKELEDILAEKRDRGIEPTEEEQAQLADAPESAEDGVSQVTRENTWYAGDSFNKEKFHEEQDTLVQDPLAAEHAARFLRKPAPGEEDSGSKKMRALEKIWAARKLLVQQIEAAADSTESLPQWARQLVKVRAALERVSAKEEITDLDITPLQKAARFDQFHLSELPTKKAGEITGAIQDLQADINRVRVARGKVAETNVRKMYLALKDEDQAGEALVPVGDSFQNLEAMQKGCNLAFDRKIDKPLPHKPPFKPRSGEAGDRPLPRVRVDPHPELPNAVVVTSRPADRIYEDAHRNAARGNRNVAAALLKIYLETKGEKNPEYVAEASRILGELERNNQMPPEPTDEQWERSEHQSAGAAGSVRTPEERARFAAKVDPNHLVTDMAGKLGGGVLSHKSPLHARATDLFSFVNQYAEKVGPVSLVITRDGVDLVRRDGSKVTDAEVKQIRFAGKAEDAASANGNAPGVPPTTPKQDTALYALVAKKAESFLSKHPKVDKRVREWFLPAESSEFVQKAKAILDLAQQKYQGEARAAATKINALFPATTSEGELRAWHSVVMRYTNKLLPSISMEQALREVLSDKTSEFYLGDEAASKLREDFLKKDHAATINRLSQITQEIVSYVHPDQTGFSADGLETQHLFQKNEGYDPDANKFYEIENGGLSPIKALSRAWNTRKEDLWSVRNLRREKSSDPEWYHFKTKVEAEKFSAANGNLPVNAPVPFAVQLHNGMVQDIRWQLANAATTSLRIGHHFKATKEILTKIKEDLTVFQPDRFGSAIKPEGADWVRLEKYVPQKSVDLLMKQEVTAGITDALYKGWIRKDVAEFLAGEMSQQSLFMQKLRGIERFARENVTTRSLFRHLKQPVENSMTAMLDDPTMAAIATKEWSKVYAGKGEAVEMAKWMQGAGTEPEMFTLFKSFGFLRSTLVEALGTGGEQGMLDLSLQELTRPGQEMGTAAALSKRTAMKSTLGLTKPGDFINTSDKFLKRAYQIEDLFFKYKAFEFHLEKNLAKGMSKEQAAEYAAQRVKDFHFDFENLPPWVQAVNKSLLFPFQASVVYNYGRILHNHFNKYGHDHMWKRALMLGAILASPGVINAMRGDKDEVKKRLGPADNLDYGEVVWITDDGKVLSYNVGPLLFAYGQVMGNPLFEKGKGNTLRNHLVGMAPVSLRPAASAVLNQDQYGRPIYNEGDDPVIASSKVADEALGTFVPFSVYRMAQQQVANKYMEESRKRPWFQSLTRGLLSNRVISPEASRKAYERDKKKELSEAKGAIKRQNYPWTTDWQRRWYEQKKGEGR